MLTEREIELAIRSFYLIFLGRESDQLGLQSWLQLSREGMDLQKIADGILSSQEYQSFTQYNFESKDQIISKAISLTKELLNEHKLVIVDVGAQNLSNESHIYAPLLQYSTRVIGFEPLEHRCNEREAGSEDTDLKIYPFFIGDGNQHVFHINNPDATSSLFGFNANITQAHVGLETLSTEKKETVQTVTLNEALKGEPEVHFLKLDIQGAELLVLENATNVLEKTLAIHCEVSFMEIYEGQPLFSEVETFLRKQGFDLIDLSSQCRYPYMQTKFSSSKDRLGWADAIFLKRLDDHATYLDRVIQSVIALVVYKKPSLAAWIVGGDNKYKLEVYSKLLNSLDLHQ